MRYADAGSFAVTLLRAPDAIFRQASRSFVLAGLADLRENGSVEVDASGCTLCLACVLVLARALVASDISASGAEDIKLNNFVQLLLDAVLGFINIEQNDLFKILTIVSVVGVPPTLLAGIWGMNFKNMPELNWQWGYALSWIAIIASGLLPLLWFKLRGWIE